MTIGARVLKTGLAVALAIFVSDLLGFSSPLIAAVAAIFTIQPSIYRSWKQILDQLQANLIGAAIALAAVYLIGSTAIAVGLVCILVIIITIRLKMESAIGLTLVTVVAVMEAHSGGWWYALLRLAMVLTGMGAAFAVNVLLFPPRPRRQFNEHVHEAFNQMSLLLRTAISNEMKEQIYSNEKELLHTTLRKLDERYRLFEEERAVTASSKQSRGRQLLVSKQMIKSLQKGMELLEVIEEHYFRASGSDAWDSRFDRQIEAWTKYHEQILLKAEGKMKSGVAIIPNQQEDNSFSSELIAFIHNQPDQCRPFVFVGATLMEYAYHLRRLDKLIEQVSQRESSEEDLLFGYK
ncbi:aromatic acid exporter family protein [Paenibacillus sp. GCM10012307]|uniref:FUSC family protein n=1 Tax=Paenibacillus roseus TaxID=2798579 RepID=A0A934IW84_9BACL|nr:aromatic acid exporter family protein [Paenibacillus roseus]MBJ6360452.1 FUSC family protein [Paenibacillus roseus]